MTHDIADLLQILSETGVEITSYLQVSQFILFAVQFRYEDEPDPLDLNREYALMVALVLLDDVHLRIEDGSP